MTGNTRKKKTKEKTFVDEELLHTLEQRGFKRGEIQIPSQLQQMLRAQRPKQKRKTRKKRASTQKKVQQPIQNVLPIPQQIEPQAPQKLLPQKEEIREIIPVQESVFKEKKESFFTRILGIFKKKEEIPKAFPQPQMQRFEIRHEELIQKPVIETKPLFISETVQEPAPQVAPQVVPQIAPEKKPQETPISEEKKVLEQKSQETKPVEQPLPKAKSIQKERVIEQRLVVVEKKAEIPAETQLPEIISVIQRQPEDSKRQPFLSRIFRKKSKEELEPIRMMTKEEQIEQNETRKEEEKKTNSQTSSGMGIFYSEPKKKS